MRALGSSVQIFFEADLFPSEGEAGNIVGSLVEGDVDGYGHIHLCGQVSGAGEGDAEGLGCRWDAPGPADVERSG